MDRAVPASFWRGGTSRAVLFREDDLSEFGPEQVEAIILASLGSPDPDGRQIDGLGGGISSLSKAAVVGPAPTGSGADVAFRFAQVEVAEPWVDFTGNCGNISAAVAPFAVNEGLVPAGDSPRQPGEGRDPAPGASADRAGVDVVVLSLNTGQRFATRVPLRGDRYDPAGDFAIDGVPGTGARLHLEYLDAGGSIGRGALPTGQVREVVELPDLGAVPVSVVDVGNPAVFVAATALDVPAAVAASPAALDADEVLQGRLERIRCEAAVRIGVADSLSDAGRHHRTVPKVALVGAPGAYRTTSGTEVAAADVDLLVRLISMGRTHRTLAMTGAMACAAAAAMDGSVVAELAGGSISATPPETGEAAGTARRVRLGHPAGILAMEVTAEGAAGAWRVPSLVVDRTAREIMRGTVQVPQAYLDGEAWFASGSPP
ncbi:MAG: hypothetical protein J4F44_06195 [Acidimicrobiia bacterium]|nr:hypothetical protein [Acidimicrobiia bacterium]